MNNDIEQQFDWLITTAFPRGAMIVCAGAVLYFGIHLLAALGKGWL